VEIGSSEKFCILLSLAEAIAARTQSSGRAQQAALPVLVLITLKTYGGETEGGSSQIKHSTRAIAPYNRGIKRDFSIAEFYMHA
jgi:hypothetical protein